MCFSDQSGSSTSRLPSRQIAAVPLQSRSVSMAANGARTQSHQQGGVNVLDENGISPLHYTAVMDSTDVARQLIAAGADLNFRSSTGQTALHFAVTAGQDDFVRFLLSNPDVDVDTVDDNGRSALHYAADTGFTMAAGLLCARGSCVAIRDKESKSAADVAVAKGHLTVLQEMANKGVKFANLHGCQALLHEAALLGQVTTIQFLLGEGVPVDATFRNYTPLMRTLMHQNLNTAKVLLAAGASVDVLHPKGNILSMAVIGGNVAMIQLILDHSKDPMQLVNDMTGGISALQAAVQKDTTANTLAIVDVLLNAGANPLIYSRNGSKSAIEICMVPGRENLFTRLHTHLFQVEKFSTKCEAEVFMDYIPEISRPLAYEPIRVPLLVGTRELAALGDSSIDHVSGFWSFPKDRGWKVEEDVSINRLDGKQESLPRLASFLQEWLYFGLLAAIAKILSVEFKPLNYVRRTPDGRFFLYTNAIMEFLRHWTDAEEAMRSEASQLAEAVPEVEDDALLNIVSRLGLIDENLQRAASIARLVFSHNAAVENLDDLYKPRMEQASTSMASQDMSESTAQTAFDESSLAILMLGDFLTVVRRKLYSGRVRLETEIHSSDGILGAQARQYESTGQLAEDSTVGRNFFQFPCRFIYKKMRANNWCRSEIHMLKSLNLATSTLYFMSLLNRPLMSKGHERCSEHECEVMKVKNSTYKTKHADGCNDYKGCKTVSVDKNAVDILLKQGRIPVVKVVPEENEDGLSLQVHDGTEGQDFVAFSHVWAHGLGNPNSNSLPTCQLRRLAKLAENASAELVQRVGEKWLDTMIWMDTLCVPARRDKSAKTAALALLPDVYRKARIVLVLDVELCAASTVSTHAEQVARVILSAWMRRLWTLQEGLLSQTVYQFADKTINYPLELGSLQREYSTLFDTELCHDLITTIRRLLPPVWHEQHENRHKLIPLLQSSSFRNTSHIADEVRCFSTLMGLDMKTLESTSGSDPEATLHNRRVVFYQMLGNESRQHAGSSGIPTHVLFMDGPRMTVPGFTWAPNSFLAREPSAILQYELGVSPGFITDRGLRVEMQGWFLEIPDCNLPDRLGWPSLRGKTIVVEDESNDIAFVITPIGEEWQVSHPFLAGRTLALLREPQLSPNALLVIVDELQEDCVIVRYGWRVTATDWSMSEFRYSSDPKDDIVEPQENFDNMDPLDRQLAVLKEELRRQYLDLGDAGLAISERTRWQIRRRLYEGRREKSRTWVIM